MNPAVSVRHVSGRPVLVAHGGAGILTAETDRRAHQEAVGLALVRGIAAIAQGASEAVLAAVAYMESETPLNAGRGAALDASGRATLDAAFMRGSDRRFGAVACVTRTPTPARLAHALMAEGDFGRLIVGPHADALVVKLGLRACDPQDLITERALHAWQMREGTNSTTRATDTVGAVALDRNGCIAAAVSTGGLVGKPPGRVGDSAIVGAGVYADDRFGACVTTGIGEVMLREGTARRCISLLGQGHAPDQAARLALSELEDERMQPRCGLVLVTAEGVVVIAHSSPDMTAGYVTPGASPAVQSRW